MPKFMVWHNSKDPRSMRITDMKIIPSTDKFSKNAEKGIESTDIQDSDYQIDGLFNMQIQKELFWELST